MPGSEVVGKPFDPAKGLGLQRRRMEAKASGRRQKLAEAKALRAGAGAGAKRTLGTPERGETGDDVQPRSAEQTVCLRDGGVTRRVTRRPETCSFPRRSEPGQSHSRQSYISEIYYNRFMASTEPFCGHASSEDNA